MDTRSNGQVEFPQDVLDCRRARDGSSGAIEDREKPVSGSSDEAPTKTPKLTIDDMIVLIHEVAPASIAKGGHPRRRIHNVGKQYRRENTLDGGRRSRSRHEFLDGFEETGAIGNGVRVVLTRNPQHTSERGYVVGDVRCVERQRPVEDGVTTAPARFDERGP
jgi:hypothetical protein